MIVVDDEQRANSSFHRWIHEASLGLNAGKRKDSFREEGEKTSPLGAYPPLILCGGAIHCALFAHSLPVLMALFSLVGA
jgi:hypothetical protein